MHISKLLTCACLGVMLSGLGCGSPWPAPPRQATASPAVQEVQCQTLAEGLTDQVVVLLVDRSDSHLQADAEHLERVRTDARALVAHLSPATAVFGYYISAQSYRGEEAFVRGTVPPVPQRVPCQVTNIFDPRQKRACQQQTHREVEQQACVTAARERLSAVLRDLSPEIARRTDVQGGLLVASEVFQAYPTSHKLMVVYSDCEDTVHRAYGLGSGHPKKPQGKATPRPQPPALPGFAGVTVIVRPPRTVTAVQHVPAFQKRLTSWGATVTVQPFEVPWQDVLRQGQHS